MPLRGRFALGLPCRTPQSLTVRRHVSPRTGPRWSPKACPPQETGVFDRRPRPPEEPISKLNRRPRTQARTQCWAPGTSTAVRGRSCGLRADSVAAPPAGRNAPVPQTHDGTESQSGFPFGDYPPEQLADNAHSPHAVPLPSNRTVQAQQPTRMIPLLPPFGTRLHAGLDRLERWSKWKVSKDKSPRVCAYRLSPRQSAASNHFR